RAASQDRRGGGREEVADGGEEGEGAVEASVVEIVEEQAADAARLVAVAEEEGLVAPTVENRRGLRAESVAGRPRGAVEMDGVLLETVVRGEVEAAAEPPDRLVP